MMIRFGEGIRFEFKDIHSFFLAFSQSPFIFSLSLLISYFLSICHSLSLSLAVWLSTVCVSLCVSIYPSISSLLNPLNNNQPLFSLKKTFLLYMWIFVRSQHIAVQRILFKFCASSHRHILVRSESGGLHPNGIQIFL